MSQPAPDGVPTRSAVAAGHELVAQLHALKLDRSLRARPRKSRYLTGVALTLGALSGAGALSSGLGRSVPAARSAEAEPQPQPIVSDTPRGGLSASGVVRPSITAHLVPTTAGRVVSVHVRQGVEVQAGQLLLQLEHGEIEAAANAAQAQALRSKAELEMRRAELDAAQAQAERAQRFLEQRAASAVQTEDLWHRVAVLKRSVEAASAALGESRANAQLLRLRRASTLVVAPISGRVVNEPPSVGDRFGGVDGKRDLEIIDFGSLVVETEIPEAQLWQIKLGARCQIVLDAFPARPLGGAVSALEPVVDRAKATVKARIALSGDTQGVLPNMSARVSFETEPAE